MRSFALLLTLSAAFAGVSEPAADPVASGWQRNPQTALPAPTPERVAPKAISSDPAGDTFNPTALPQHDLRLIQANVVGSDLVVELTFGGPISFGQSGQSDALFGFIDLDTDFAPGEQFQSNINTFCDPAQRPAIGTDFHVFLNTATPTFVNVINTTTGANVGNAGTFFTMTTLRVTVPLSLIAYTGNLSVATVIGPTSAPTDCAPNAAALTVALAMGPPSVSLTVAPERIVQNATVLLSWNPMNVTACTPTGGAPGTTFSVMPNNTATAAVSVGATPRNDIFRIGCSGPNGSASNTAVLSVGVPPAPPPRPIANISVGPGGAAADAGSSSVNLSDGARFVVFESNATNLIAGDTNGRGDVFRRDTMSGQTLRVSLDNGQQQDLFSGEAQVSRNGRFITFTRGTGSGPGPTVATKAITGGEICIRDMDGNVLTCVSKGPGGSAANGASGRSWGSGDGGKIVYESTASNIAGTVDGNGGVSDIYAYTKSTNTTQLVSNASSGAAASAASNGPHLSCNGNNIVFESLAPLLGTGATAGIRNVYAANFSGGGKRLVTRGLSNANANGDSINPRISDDGRYTFFESAASNLVTGDTNARVDVFVHDNALGTIRRLSVSSAGVQANGDSRRPRIPCDGTYVMFDSTATNLIAGDGNAQSDVFLVDLGTGTVALASQTGGGTQGNGSSANGQVSPDGTAVGFDSNAGTLGGVASGSVFAGANPFAGQNFTGAWFDPNQSGHGLFLDQLPDGRLVAWWFTFDPSGQQAWFGGTGLINGNTAVINIVRTQGARFIPNFVSAQALNTPIGTLTFTFTGCASGRVDFALDTTFGNGFMNLTRLSAPVGVACTPTAEAMALAAKMGLPKNWRMEHSADFGPTVVKATEPTAGPIAGMTGAWFDPAQSGHGLFLENLGNGNLLAWWFTFGPAGGQAWFGGVGTITSGTRASISFVKTAGGRWIPNFNPANVTNPVLGPVEIVLTSCSAGRIDYQFVQGFGTGSMPLVPLVRAAGTSCNG